MELKETALTIKLLPSYPQLSTETGWLSTEFMIFARLRISREQLISQKK